MPENILSIDQANTINLIIAIFLYPAGTFFAEAINKKFWRK